MGTRVPYHLASPRGLSFLTPPGPLPDPIMSPPPRPSSGVSSWERITSARFPLSCALPRRRFPGPVGLAQTSSSFHISILVSCGWGGHLPGKACLPASCAISRFLQSRFLKMYLFGRVGFSCRTESFCCGEWVSSVVPGLAACGLWDSSLPNLGTKPKILH